ncbi:thioesterase family protein [Penicillium chermesinum]|uniref:Thioesterase family protein n=1 Tax=Penicillium chermesinum TaxID=63820 RepID=A0A9W9TRM3_9EURO|nr:thioesterase family protein [Penicillium chermesinum]KAJ5238851.1 thioesterase family protein [Penicillium chermesinum]
MGDVAVEVDIDHKSDLLSSQILHFIHNHPSAVSLREDPAVSEVELRLDIPDEERHQNLMTGALAGPKKLIMSPFLFRNAEERSMVMFFYVGSGVCGHPGIVHGGVLATIVDEGLARCCFPHLPNKVGVTANLNIDYRAPAMANSYIAFRAATTRVEGRKAWVEGEARDAPG